MIAAIGTGVTQLWRVVTWLYRAVRPAAPPTPPELEQPESETPPPAPPDAGYRVAVPVAATLLVLTLAVVTTALFIERGDEKPTDPTATRALPLGTVLAADDLTCDPTETCTGLLGMRLTSDIADDDRVTAKNVIAVIDPTSVLVAFPSDGTNVIGALEPGTDVEVEYAPTDDGSEADGTVLDGRYVTSTGDPELVVIELLAADQQSHLALAGRAEVTVRAAG